MAREKKYRIEKKKNGISLMTLLKNSFSTSLKSKFFFENLSKAKTIRAPSPKKPKAKPNPEAKTAVLGLFGAVEKSQYATIRLVVSNVQNKADAQKIQDQINSFIRTSLSFLFFSSYLESSRLDI